MRIFKYWTRIERSISIGGQPEKVHAFGGSNVSVQAAAADAELVKYLQDYVKKSPAEHLREAVLKQMGLTEEDLAAMPTEKRLATEAEINRRIREKLLGHKESEDPAAGDLPPASALATTEGSGGAVASPVADQLNDAMAA